MAEETVDTLELVISAKATDAADKVKDLSTSVSNFGKEISSYISQMGNLADVLERIADAAKGLSAIKNIQDVIGRVASAASKAKASAVGKAFQPIVPPKRPSDTVRGGTRLARTQGGGAYRYNVSADDLARQLNAKYNTTYSNKALSAEIQRIRNAQMSGGGGTQETMGLAGMIAKTAQIKGASDGLVSAMNSVFKTLDVTLEEAVYLAKQYGTSRLGATKRKELDADYERAKKNQYRDLSDAEAERIIHGYGGLDAANAALRKAGATFQVRYGRGGAGIDSLINGTNVREIGEEAFMLRSALAGSGVDVDNPQIEDIFYALDRAKNDRHGAFMSEYGFGANMSESQLEQMLTGDLFEQLTDMIGAGKPEDLEAPIREAKTAVENAKKEAEEAARILREENEAWKSQASWNREQDARYKDEYGGREKKWQMEADWRAYEAENAVPADDPQRLREEIAGFNQIADAEVPEAAKAVADENERAAKANVYAASAAEAEAKFLEYVVKLRQQTYKAFNPKTGQFDIPVNWNGERLDQMEEAKETPKPEEVKTQVDPLAEMERKMPHIDVQDLMENATPGDILQMKLDNVRNALESEGAKMQQDPAKIASLAEQYQRLTDKLERYKDAMREAGEAEGESSGKVGKLRGVLDALRETIGGSRLGKNMSQLFRVAKMRLFRDAVKAVTAAIKEGIGNLYQWSKMNNGHFAGAMDTMASKFMLIKNSVATAVAPLIESFVPVIAQVAQWVNQASNALAQFFALLTGQTSWTMATESAEEWAAATKTGAGNTKQAAKEAKDLLADWDELNIIQQKANDATGGGSGSKGKKAPDYASMFKEMTVFDEWTEHFEAIRDIVIAIGAGIALWFATDTVHDFLGQIGIAGDKVDGVFAKIKKGATGAVLLGVSFILANDAGKTIANEGLSGPAILESIGSLAAGALGGYMLGSAIAGPTGGMIGTIAGLAIDVIIGINAYYEERNNNAREVIRGLLDENVFKFDIDAVAEEVHVTIGNAEQARENTRKSLEQTLTDIEVLKIGVNRAESWDKIYKDVMDKGTGLLANIRKELEADSAVVTLYYQMKQKTSNPAENGEGGSTTDAEAFKLDLKVNDVLRGYYDDLGREFAECFTEGETAAIKKGKEDLALAIMNQIADAQKAAEEARGEAELKIGLAESMKGTDAKTVMRNMGATIGEYEKKIANVRRDATKAYIVSQESALAQLKKLDPESTLIGPLDAKIKEAWEEFNNKNYEADVHAEFIIDNADVIKQFIKDNFTLSGKDWEQFFSENGGVNSTFADYLFSDFSDEEKRGRAERELTGRVNKMLGLDFGSTLLKDYGIGLDEIFGEEFVRGLAGTLLERSGHDEENVRLFLDELSVTPEFLDKLFGGGQGEEPAEPAAVKEEPQEAVDLDQLKAEADARQAAEDAARAAGESATAATEAKLAADAIKEANENKYKELDADDALQDWWDTYRNYMEGNYELWGGDTGAGYDEEQAKREVLLDKLGIAGDKFVEVLNKYLESNANDPFGEEDLPDWLFGWTDEPTSDGATISGGGGNPGTAWFSGPQDESFEMDATGSGLATESSLDNLKGVNTTGFTSVEDILKALNKTMGDVNDNTRRVAEKDFSVNVYPTSGWGGFNQRSGEKREAVTGGP